MYMYQNSYKGLFYDKKGNTTNKLISINLK